MEAALRAPTTAFARSRAVASGAGRQMPRLVGEPQRQLSSPHRSRRYGMPPSRSDNFLLVLGIGTGACAGIGGLLGALLYFGVRDADPLTSRLGGALVEGMLPGMMIGGIVGFGAALIVGAIVVVLAPDR